MEGKNRGRQEGRTKGRKNWLAYTCHQSPLPALTEGSQVGAEGCDEARSGSAYSPLGCRGQWLLRLAVESIERYAARMQGHGAEAHSVWVGRLRMMLAWACTSGDVLFSGVC